MRSLSLVAPKDRNTVEDMLNKRFDGVNVPREFEIRCTTKSGFSAAPPGSNTMGVGPYWVMRSMSR
jgi:hypothetical protein